MTQERPGDPTALDPACVAYHQLLTFDPARPGLLDALDRSPLFSVRRRDSAATCEWVQLSTESDRSPFPLGRLRAVPGGVLLEAFSERRLAALRRAAREAGAGEIVADQLRVFRIGDALADPSRLLQPLHELEGEPLTAREVAADYLRMAWAWIPHPDLGARTPAAALGTGRGRALVEKILETLGPALRREIPSFPAMGPEALRAVLLPDPAPARPEPVRPPSVRSR